MSLVLAVFAMKFLEKKITCLNKKRTEKRHLHNKKGRQVSRLGGVAIIVAFVVTIILDKNLLITKDIWGIIFGGFFILLVGFLDDLKEIGWKVQLFFQFIAVSLVFIFGARIHYITNPFGEAIQFDSDLKIAFGVLLAIIWSLVLINAMNWLDGIDGLSGGVALVGAMTIFLLSLKPEVNQPPVAIIAIALAGSLLAFLILNFYPAKIMAGTSGAFFMGFILASLSVFAGTKIATTLLVLIIPIIDFFWVIGRRIKLKKSIFEADREHLHHKLLDMGWSQRKISLFFYSITVSIALIALNIGASGKVALVALLILVAFLFFGLINNYNLYLKK
jgi:UDP-GlcNAc:undecaprenyl-phosphate GlcNAc-1-phosphate transferase